MSFHSPEVHYKDWLKKFKKSGLFKYPFRYFSKIKRIKTIVYVVKIVENFWTGTYQLIVWQFL